MPVRPDATTGEVLLDAAAMLRPRGLVVAAGMSAVGLAKTAMDLARHPVLALRSVVEEWDMARIIMEVY